MTPQEIAQDIYTNSLVLVDFINSHIVKVNLPPNLISEVQSRVDTLENIVVDLSNSGTSLDLSPLRNAINTGKAFTASSSTVPAPGFAGTPPSQAPGFADPGYAVPDPVPDPGFADPGFADPVPAPELTDFQALNYIASNSDLISAIGTDIEAAKSHYSNFGKVEGRALDDFDEWGYLASNNDLLTNFGGDPTEAVKIYISFGKSEGRSTNIFNADSYLNNYADLKNVFGNDHTLAKKHYVESGFMEGRTF